MKSITVEYLLTEEQAERLFKIASAYEKKGIHTTEETHFGFIMTEGARWEIDDRLSLHEWRLGMSDSWNRDSWKKDWKKQGENLCVRE